MKATATALLVLLVIATAASAAKPERTTSTIVADFVAHTEAFIPLGPMLLSRCSGKSTSKYYVEWPRHDLCVFTVTFDALGNVISSDEGVKPNGMQAEPGRTKELCKSDELCDDPILTASLKKDVINSVQFYLQDDTGPEGIQYETEKIVLDTPVQGNKCGFAIHVHRDGIPVWKMSGHVGGSRVAIVGTISIGDVWYRPSTPCSQ